MPTPLNKSSRLKRLNVSLFVFVVSVWCFAVGSDKGIWIDADVSEIRDVLTLDSQTLPIRETTLPLTGGEFWHSLPVTINSGEKLVIDFQNSSVVGKFTHYVVNSDNDIIKTYVGGLQSTTVNPYLLRHGRNLDLEPGRYRVITHMVSPFLLAQPKPSLYEQEQYSQSIKIGNSITLLALGVFLAMGVYYFVLGITRRQPTDYLYSIFILGNLIYNSTALNVLSDLFKVPAFFSIGFPIMASNMAYIAFVMALLGLSKKRTPRLYTIGISSLILLGSFWLLVPFMPNYSLEFARIGVGVFGLYGVSCGIVMALKGQKTARYYLIANIAFIIPGVISIVLQSLPGSTMFIEHLGLFAVAMEVILLSLVLNYQLSVVYKEKTANLLAAEEALKVADDAIKAKERFLANISHELRTPLNAIQGSVDLLSIKNNNPDALEHVEIIRHSSSFLLFLINDILDLAKLNADMLVIENRAFNLKSMVTQISSIYGSSFTVNSKAKFNLDIAPEVPTFIVSDEKRIEQVIANLLSNAFKFTDSGTVTFSLTVSEDKEFIVFSVRDNGIGIAPENLDSMFSAFTQADSSISRKYGGTGLGLRIASKIIELMGGQIAAESKPDHGSNFWFTIPIKVAHEEDVEQDEDQSGKNYAEIRFNDLNVIVVDDNVVNLKVTNALLNKLEATCTSFDNASEGMDAALTGPVDILIMDIQMPEIDGLTASRHLRKQGFVQPIIAFTANASEEDQIACFDAGMNDILIKPIKLQNLVQVLRKWRGRAQSSIENTKEV
jgi:signal transduction histidine kinase/CheY-like chemotaxis protein